MFLMLLVTSWFHIGFYALAELLNVNMDVDEVKEFSERLAKFRGVEWQPSISISDDMITLAKDPI